MLDRTTGSRVGHWLLSLPLALLAAAGEARDSSDVVAVGGTLDAVLEPEDDGAAVTVAAGPPGPLTVVVSSLDFDPSVVVRTEDGEVLGGDDESGVGQDAWLVVERPTNAPLAITIRSRDGLTGTYSVTVGAGVVALPSGVDRQRLEWERLEAIGRRAAERERWQRSARFLILAGTIRSETGQYERATTLLKEAAAAAKQVDARLELAIASAYLGAAERNRRRLDAASEALTRATALFAGLPPHLGACLAWEELGRVRLAQGETEAAREAFLRFREAAEAVSRPELAALATARLGVAHERAGALEEAGRVHAEAVARVNALRTPAPYYEAQVLHLAGWFHESRGELAEARTLLDRAYQLVPGNLRGMRVEIQARRASVLSRLGRYSIARACVEELRTLVGSDTDPVVLFMLADLSTDLGESERALELFERVAASPLAATDQGLRADVAVSRANVLLTLGRPEDARSVVVKALAHIEGDDSLAADRRFRLVYNLARADEFAGRLETAADYYDEARDLAERTGSTSNLAAANVAWAYVQLLRGEPAAARERLTATFDHLAPHSELTTALAALDTLGGVAIAEQDPSAARVALARAHELLDGLDVRRLDANERAGVRARFATFSELAHDLAALESRLRPEDRELACARGLEESGRWKGRTILEALPRARSARGPADAFLDALRARLGPSRVLLEYAEGRERLYVYRVSTTDAALVDLGPKNALFERVVESRRGLDDRDRLAPASKVVARGAALYRDLVARALDGHETSDLVIAPTGVLATYPFDALVLERGGVSDGTFDAVTFVGDRLRVTYAPSAVVFQRISSRLPPQSPDRVLFLADPVLALELGRDPGSPSDSDLFRLERLEASHGEILAIARALLIADAAPDDMAALKRLVTAEHARSSPITTSRFDAFLGTYATVSKLTACASEYAVLHFAAHGLLDDVDPMRSGLVLSFEEETHGFLSLADVLELPLDARLTVLSACRTAEGRMRRGEGVQSLAHAFLRAGSRAVVATLWPVEDLKADATMRAFYQGLIVDRVPPAEALRRAKALTRRGGTRGVSARTKEDADLASVWDAGHPYYWAAFVYTGALEDGR